MPLFRCEKCGRVENTATGWWWSRNMKGTPDMWRRALCSEHGPKFIDGSFSEEECGEWHNSFNKNSATGWYVDESLHIWQDLKGAPHAYGKHIGKYAEDGSIIPLTEEEAAEHSRLNSAEVIRQQQEAATRLHDAAVGNPKVMTIGRPWVSLSNKKSKQKKKV